MVGFGDGIKPRILAVSYSRISTHEKCARLAKYKFIDKLKEPENAAMTRGRNLHTLAEKFLHDPSQERVPDALFNVNQQLLALRAEIGATVKTEQQLAWDKAWQSTSWFGPQAFMRCVYDASGIDPEHGGRIILADHKSGKVYPTHDDQKSLYAMCGFFEWPEANEMDVRFIYIDQGFSTPPAIYNREQLDGLLDHWKPRIEAVTSDEVFAPNPSAKKCGWCHFRRSNNGPCEHG